jgi:hypothetical protein
MTQPYRVEILNEGGQHHQGGGMFAIAHCETRLLRPDGTVVVKLFDDPGLLEVAAALLNEVRAIAEGRGHAPR